MRIADDEKNKIINFFMGVYDDRECGKSPEELGLSGLNPKAVDFIACSIPSDYHQSRSLFRILIESLVDMYQNSQDYELWFTEHYEALDELDSNQLKLLGARIDMMAFEKAIRQNG